MCQTNTQNSRSTFPILEARFDSGRALTGLFGSLLIAAICICAGQHYALIGGLIGLVGIACSIRGIIDSRLRLRIDGQGVHLPLSHTTIAWWDIEAASWRVVTRGASRQEFVVLTLHDGQSLQLNIGELSVSLAEVFALIEDGLLAKSHAATAWN